MPKIRAGFPFKLEGKQVNIGEEVSVDDVTARRKVADGHARIVDENKNVSKHSEPVPVTETPQAVPDSEATENVTSTSTTEHTSTTPTSESPSGKAQKSSKVS